MFTARLHVAQLVSLNLFTETLIMTPSDWLFAQGLGSFGRGCWCGAWSRTAHRRRLLLDLGLRKRTNNRNSEQKSKRTRQTWMAWARPIMCGMQKRTISVITLMSPRETCTRGRELRPRTHTHTPS